VCDIAYGSEIINPLWAPPLVPGATYYLAAGGGFALASPPGALQQEIGFARNPITMVFRPTIVTR